jgi:hypothetical protein
LFLKNNIKYYNNLIDYCVDNIDDLSVIECIMNSISNISRFIWMNGFSNEYKKILEKIFIKIKYNNNNFIYNNNINDFNKDNNNNINNNNDNKNNENDNNNNNNNFENKNKNKRNRIYDITTDNEKIITEDEDEEIKEKKHEEEEEEEKNKKIKTNFNNNNTNNFNNNNNLKQILSNFLYSCGTIYYSLGEFEKSKELFQNCLNFIKYENLFNEYNNNNEYFINLMGKLFNSFGQLKREMNYLDDALKYHYNSMSLYEKLNENNSFKKWVNFIILIIIIYK